MFLFLNLACRCDARAAASHRRNIVADYLNSAQKPPETNDRNMVIRQALVDALHEPIKTFRNKRYPGYDMQPDAWAINLLLERYFEPEPAEQDIVDEAFFRDLKRPEAQNAIRWWLNWIDGPLGPQPTKRAGIDQHNTVAEYLTGAEEQVETDDQQEAIRQVFIDMLNEPVETLRRKRYPDYQLHPDQWPITEVLYRYFVPPRLYWFDGDNFFRDVKKPEAQREIRIWLGWLNGPLYPQREKRARNTVAEFLNGADQRSETDAQKSEIKQALTDMLNEPVDRLRTKRYPDYEMRPGKWSITAVLEHYYLTNQMGHFDNQIGHIEGGYFFRDVKTPEAQKEIRVWLDWMNGPPGPQPEYRP